MAMLCRALQGETGIRLTGLCHQMTDEVFQHNRDHLIQFEYCQV